MIKKLLAIIVLVMIASLSIAGCTSSTSSNQTPSAATHDAFLENYLTAYKNAQYSDNGQHVQAWELDWINSTSARIQFTVFNISANNTINSDGTIIVFPTTQDATNYVNTMNLTAYSLARTEYPSGGAYVNATGHAPQIYKVYEYNEGNPLNISEYKLHGISQADTLVYVQTVKALS
ncbi:MAG: hypothetical protein WAL97_07475 [Halobacteriota archaeon]|jgi:hypothetical protein